MWSTKSLCFITFIIKTILCCENVNLWTERFHTVKNAMDLTENPCNNFYNYACGNWERVNKNQSEDSLKLSEKKLLQNVKSFLEDSKFQITSVSEQNVKNLYQSCKTQNLTKNEKLQTYIKTLKKFGNWPIIDSHWPDNDFDWIRATAFLRSYGVNAFIRQLIKPNWNNSSQMIIYLTQPKFTFITRNDLLSPSSGGNEYVFLYKRYIKYLMLDLGCKIKQAKSITEEIFDFETELASITVDEADIPIPTPKTLENSLEIEWNKYFTILMGKPVSSSTTVAIQETYFEKLGNLINTSRRETVAKYLLFKFMLHFKIGLTEDMTEDSTERCIKDVSVMMGSVLEQALLRDIDSEQKKQGIENIFIQLKKTFKGVLEETTWIDNKTRKEAELKLEKMKCQIGLLDKFETNLDQFYEKFQINISNYQQTLLNFAQFKTQQEHKQLDGNKSFISMLNMDSLKINAYYRLTDNTLYIPIGLMQFYDDCFQDAWIFGTLGSMLGHEILHAFDLEGRNYDALGNIRDWWTTKSFIGYFSNADCLIEQHNNLTGSDVSGLRTLSENIADNGGLKLSYKTYTDLNSIVSSASQIDLETLTNSQLFFLSFAQTWCSDGKQSSALHSKHTSHKHRVIGVLSNYHQFSDAFQCPTGSQMNPPKKCKLW